MRLEKQTSVSKHSLNAYSTTTTKRKTHLTNDKLGFVTTSLLLIPTLSPSTKANDCVFSR